jgi:hypothetical protein
LSKTSSVGSSENPRISFSIIGEELEDFTKLRGGMVMDGEGPLWYRGLAQNPTRLDHHYGTLRVGMRGLFQELGTAA